MTSPADVLTTPTTAPAPDVDEPVAPAAVEPAPVAPADVARPTKQTVKRGKVVSYVFRDPITGAQLDGLGVCVDVPDDGAVCVVPIQSNYLFVPAEGVQVVELGG